MLWRITKKKMEREEKGVGGAEERGGEQERYALLEDWERKTTGRSEREGSRERERKNGEGKAKSGRRASKVFLREEGKVMRLLMYVILGGHRLCMCVCTASLT